MWTYILYALTRGGASSQTTLTRVSRAMSYLEIWKFGEVISYGLRHPYSWALVVAEWWCTCLIRVVGYKPLQMLGFSVLSKLCNFKHVPLGGAASSLKVFIKNSCLALQLEKEKAHKLIKNLVLVL